MEIFLPLIIGFAAGVFATYLMTPKEYRAALFARLHSTIDDLHQKIAAAIAKAREKDTPK